MSKRLILILALAFVVGICCAAYAEVQNVKVGGDLNFMGVTRDGFNLRKDKVGADATLMIGIVKIDADLTDNVSATVGMRTERIWGISRTATGATTGDDNFHMSLGYVTLKEFLYSPLTVKVGYMPVRLGSGFLVGDSDTNQTSSGAFSPGFGDLSSRKAFNGILALLDYSPLKLTLGGLKTSEGTYIETKQDDVNTYIVSAAYDTGVKNTVAELNYVLKNTNNKGASTAHNEVHNIGTRITSKPLKDLSVSGEFIYQTQKELRGDKRIASDTGLLLTADYALKNVTYSPSLGVLYLRVSDNWNSMFEDLTTGDIINVLLPLTNFQAIGANVSLKPIEDVTAKIAYTNARLTTAVPSLTGWSGDSTVWASRTLGYTMTTKKDLGNEVDLNLAYAYTEDVKFGLNLGYFRPGAAFDKDANRKSASQVIGSMKVTF